MNSITTQLLQKKISVADAIVNILPKLSGKMPDETVRWLISELQGYANSLEFYKDNQQDFPDYRVVSGSLKLLDTAGQFTDLAHPFANRGKYFLSGPVSWLEESALLPGELALADLPDLTAYLGAGRGTVVCEFPRDQLNKALANIRQKVISLIRQCESTAEPSGR